jgi:hypothetical protein
LRFRRPAVSAAIDDRRRSQLFVQVADGKPIARRWGALEQAGKRLTVGANLDAFDLLRADSSGERDRPLDETIADHDQFEALVFARDEQGVGDRIRKRRFAAHRRTPPRLAEWALLDFDQRQCIEMYLLSSDGIEGDLVGPNAGERDRAGTRRETIERNDKGLEHDLGEVVAPPDSVVRPQRARVQGRDSGRVHGTPIRSVEERHLKRGREARGSDGRRG